MKYDSTIPRLYTIYFRTLKLFLFHNILQLKEKDRVYVVNVEL